MPKRSRSKKRAVKLSLFGNVLHNLRLDMDITEEELVARASIAVSTYKQLLTANRKIIRRVRVVSLCNALALPDGSADRDALIAAWEAMPTPDHWIRSPLAGNTFASSQTAEAIARGVELSDFDNRQEIAAFVRTDAWRQLLDDAELATIERAHPYDWLSDPTFPIRYPEQAAAWTGAREDPRDDFGDASPSIQ